MQVNAVMPLRTGCSPRRPFPDAGLECAAPSCCQGEWPQWRWYPWSRNAATSQRVNEDVFVAVGITSLNVAAVKLANSTRGYHCCFSKDVSSQTSASQLCRLSVCANLQSIVAGLQHSEPSPFGLLMVKNSLLGNIFFLWLSWLLLFDCIWFISSGMSLFCWAYLDFVRHLINT